MEMLLGMGKPVKLLLMGMMMMKLVLIELSGNLCWN
jgi:hypothetical protein